MSTPRVHYGLFVHRRGARITVDEAKVTCPLCIEALAGVHRWRVHPELGLR